MAAVLDGRGHRVAGLAVLTAALNLADRAARRAYKSTADDSKAHRISGGLPNFVSIAAGAISNHVSAFPAACLKDPS